MDRKGFYFGVAVIIGNAATAALVFMLLWKWHAHVVIDDPRVLSYWESLGVTTLISYVTHQLPSSADIPKTRSQERAHRYYVLAMTLLTSVFALVIGGLAELLS